MRINFKLEKSKSNLALMILFSLLSLYSLPLTVIAILIYIYFEHRGLENILYCFITLSAGFFLIDCIPFRNNLISLFFSIPFTLLVLNSRNSLIQKYRIQVPTFEKFVILGLVNFHLIVLIKGKQAILSHLLIGYDNVGHFSMMQTIKDCRSYLTECILTGTATPEGYRNYPQYFHVSFAKFIDLLGIDNRIIVYFVISSTIYVLNVYFMLRIFNIFNETFEVAGVIRVKKRKSQAKINKRTHEKSKTRSVSRSIKYASLLARTFLILAATYIHSLGYLNFEYAILLLLFWIICIKQKLFFNPHFASLIIFMASSASYPLLVIPNTVLFLSIIFNSEYYASRKIKGIYIFGITLFATLKIAENISTNAVYLTSEGGSPVFMLAMLGTTILYICTDVYKSKKILIYLTSNKILNLVLVINLGFTFILFLFNQFRGNSPGYYTQKMCMFLMIFMIPPIYGFARETGLLQKTLRLFLVKSLVSIIAVSALFSISPEGIYSSFKNQLFFLSQPAIYLQNLVSFSGIKESQSLRILNSAKLISPEDSPILLHSESSVQDTIWVNTLRSTWGQQLESSMWGGILENPNKKNLIFEANDGSYWVSRL